MKAPVQDTVKNTPKTTMKNTQKGTLKTTTTNASKFIPNPFPKGNTEITSKFISKPSTNDEKTPTKNTVKNFTKNIQKAVVKDTLKTVAENITTKTVNNTTKTTQKHTLKPDRKNITKNTVKNFTNTTTKNSLFARVPVDAQKILDSFDGIIQGIQPLSSKQLRFLPTNIRDLSHELTDERSSRRSGYMNETVRLSAYTRYFVWWNLVRLTTLFAGFPKDAFSFLQDGRYCLDVGSGPLTVPIALYLARPELRSVKLSWYCIDISQNALSLGENLLLSVAARLTGESWKVIRIKGELGIPLKNKVSFVTCANMFNELYWNTSRPLEEIAKKYGASLLSYAEKQSIVFVAEPGIPRASRFVSLFRDFLLRKDLSIVSPCTHAEICPMDGRKGGKWCHFVLDGEVAPKALQKLSTQAGLPKDRASISFVFASTDTSKKSEMQTLRIISDPIFIPGALGQQKKRGRYACAPWGLSLVMEYNDRFVSGDTVDCPLSPSQVQNLPIDAKSKAKII